MKTLHKIWLRLTPPKVFRSARKNPGIVKVLNLVKMNILTMDSTARFR